MAEFDFDFPNILDGLEDVVEEAAPKMIKEALPVYQNSVQSSLAPHKDTGDLIDSIRCKGPKRTKTDAYIGYLTADGTSRKTTYTRENGKTEAFRNYQKALALEYGNSHQAATPFLQNAKESCEDAVMEKMQQVFDREVNG